MRIGFELFSPTASGDDVAFVPLAMPIMFGPGTIATLCQAYAKPLVGRIGPKGIDAATRLVGFFVATMGMGLIFHGLVEAFQSYGLMVAR